MRFNFTFSQALDVSSLFFMEQYVYHSQFTSKFFFGLHNSFLILNYNNSFFCIKRALNFLESSLINRSYILSIGEFYNFFFKSIKFFKYLNILNLEQIPNGFLTNYKQYFTPNKLVKFSTLRKWKKINKTKIKFTRLKNFDNRFITLQRKKKDWISQKYAFHPPSIAILFNISKSYWIINELKLIKIPIIGLIYPKTELDSRIIQYPIPILHGFDFDFNEALLSDISTNVIQNIGQKTKKVKTDKFKENLIDLFFLFLFILISFQSYKKLILKFINKSVIFFKNNSLVNYSNIFNLYSYKKFNLAKKFYKKSFLRFYIKMWSKIKINSNLFFQNKSIRFIDRSLLWKPKKNQWFLKKWIRTRKKVKAHVFAFRNIYINQPRFWVQKKNIWNFKGFGMLRKLKLKQTRLVPFVNTILHRNLIASPLNRISFYQLQEWNYKRFDVGFKNISDLFPFFYKVLRKFKSKTFRRKRRFLFYKYKLSSHIYDTKFLKFGNYSIVKKKKNFKYLYRFKKPLYFSRRFILTRLSAQRKNTLRENLKVLIKSVLKSSDVIKKNRFLGYLKSKINKNQYILQRKNFLNYYSARYWWLYKKPILLYLTLNKKKKNKKFIQNYNFFLRDYNFRTFNLRLNMHVKKTFFLVNHDNKFLSKFRELHHFFITRSYDTLDTRFEWLERYRKKRQKKLKKKKKNLNNYKNLIVLRPSQKNVIKYLDKMHRRFKQLYKYKLKTVLNQYKILYAYNYKYINSEKIRPFFSVLTSKSISNISKKITDIRSVKATSVFKKNVQKLGFKSSYSKYRFTCYFLQASQKFFSKFSINMSTYLRRSRVYKKISRIRRPMGRFKVLQRKTREYRFKRHWFLRRKKYKMKYIFFSSIRKNRPLLLTKNRLNFFRNHLMSNNKNVLQNAPKFLLRNWKLEGHHFFFKRYLRLFIFKIIKLQKKKKMLYFLNKKYKLRHSINNNKLIFRFFFKKKNRKISVVKFNKKQISSKLFKTYKKLYKKIYIRSTYHFIRRLKKRKNRLFINHFLRLKLSNNFKILSKIFTIGDLNFRLGFRFMDRLSAWPRKKMSSFFLRSNLIDLIKNHRRKKYFFFSYSRNFDMANRFNRKFFTRWIYRPGFITHTNKETMDEIVHDLKIQKTDFNLWKSLRWVNKVRRQFAELTKTRAFYLRGNYHKKVLIRQSSLKVKKYDAMKLFLISSIYSNIVQSKYADDDIRGLILQKKNNKKESWSLAKNEFWRYWLAMQNPLFCYVDKQQKVERRQLIVFLKKKHKILSKKKFIKSFWLSYKNLLIFRIHKLKRLKLKHLEIRVFKFKKNSKFKKLKNQFFLNKRQNSKYFTIKKNFCKLKKKVKYFHKLNNKKKLSVYIRKYFRDFWLYYKQPFVWKATREKRKNDHTSQWRKIFKSVIKHLINQNSGWTSRKYLIANLLSLSLHLKKFNLWSTIVLMKTLRVYRGTLNRLRIRFFPYIFFFNYYRYFYLSKHVQIRHRKIINRMILIRYNLFKSPLSSKNENK